MAYKGKYKPRNPSKYKGDPTNIIYRSLWEAKVFRYMDTNDQINWWQSEEVSVRYRNPKTGRISRYFPDLVFEVKKEQGNEIYMVEIKPEKQMVPPTPPKSGKPTKRFINEAVTYAINDAKWRAAEEFCADRGWKFQKWGETVIGVGK